MVAAGELGEVRLVTGRYFQDWLLLPTDWNWRLRPDRGGALRAVGDIGSHWLDLMTFVTGHRIVEVMADLATFIPVRQEPTGPVETFSTERSAETVERAIQTEDAALDPPALRQRRPRLGRRSRRSAPAGRTRSIWEIDGAEGSLAWDSENPDQIWAGHRERPNEILVKNPALMAPAGQRTAALPGGHVEGFADTFAALFRAIHADVALGRPSAHPAYPTFADGHDEMLVNDAIAESARTGCWVAVARDPD